MGSADEYCYSAAFAQVPYGLSLARVPRGLYEYLERRLTCQVALIHEPFVGSNKFQDWGGLLGDLQCVKSVRRQPPYDLECKCAMVLWCWCPDFTVASRSQVAGAIRGRTRRKPCMVPIHLSP